MNKVFFGFFFSLFLKPCDGRHLFTSLPPRVALDRAAVLLTMKREMIRLDNVWGVGGGLRPVKHLVKEVNIRPWALTGSLPCCS